MAYTLDDAIGGVRASREHFYKHIEGVKNDQWDWQPYPQCKSIRETLAHLVIVDRGFLYTLQTGKAPEEWDQLFPNWQPYSPDQLRTVLLESRANLITHLESAYADVPLDKEVSLYGVPLKLGQAICGISSEDYYHAGQVAYVRMASDPTWDYYATVYGM